MSQGLQSGLLVAASLMEGKGIIQGPLRASAIGCYREEEGSPLPSPLLPWGAAVLMLPSSETGTRS